MYGLLWLRSLQLLVVFALAFFLGIWAAKTNSAKSGMNVSMSDIFAVSMACLKYLASQAASRITTAAAISGFVISLSAFALGYMYRDHELLSNERTLMGLEIVKEYPAGNYDARTEAGTNFPFNPCQNSPRLTVGIYRLVRYEQRNGCKIVKYWLPNTNQKGEMADAR